MTSSQLPDSFPAMLAVLSAFHREVLPHLVPLCTSPRGVWCLDQLDKLLQEEVNAAQEWWQTGHGLARCQELFQQGEVLFDMLKEELEREFHKPETI